MAVPVTIRAAAQADVVDAGEAYDRQANGLGDRFLAAFERFTDAVSRGCTGE